MTTNNLNMIEAQCFFRQMLKERKHNKSVSKLDTEQRRFWEKITFYLGRVPELHYNTASNIVNQINDLIIKLIPLYQVGLRYDIYLIGGALRDFMLAGPTRIKDLDILFSINKDSIKTVLERTPLITLESIIGKDLHSKIDWNNDSETNKIHGLFNYILSKNYDVEKAFTIDDIESKAIVKDDYENILTKELEGLISMNGTDNSFPMDILLTTAKIDDYLKTFSFEICKAYVPFFQHEHARMMPSVFYFLESIHVTNGFMRDAMEETISMYMPNFGTIQKIEKAVKNHLPRVIEKYSKHKINLLPGHNEEYQKWKKTYEQYIELHGSLPQKEVTISSLPPKMKI